MKKLHTELDTKSGSDDKKDSLISGIYSIFFAQFDYIKELVLESLM